MGMTGRNFRLLPTTPIKIRVERWKLNISNCSRYTYLAQ
jgi:hypothetical protein